ncbi:hypothetical protein [Thermoleophilum album]|uniref:Uncharacterized protein n=1 Tax=Thermoleophilum album TaxID=29539 RepID=A0A1H6FH75_THEAL|nr:hypothetical protein [Thermoleophilum album]SEH10156.1 hypothetical protein SAMN02745716_0002 [Thermoleophilum album]
MTNTTMTRLPIRPERVEAFRCLVAEELRASCEGEDYEELRGLLPLDEQLASDPAADGG